MSDNGEHLADASAIASTSMMSVMATENGGMTLARAKKLTPESIIERLSGTT